MFWSTSDEIFFFIFLPSLSCPPLSYSHCLLADPCFSREFRSTSYLSIGVLRLQMCAFASEFLHGFWESNFGDSSLHSKYVNLLCHLTSPYFYIFSTEISHFCVTACTFIHELNHFSYQEIIALFTVMAYVQCFCIFLSVRLFTLF